MRQVKIGDWFVKQESQAVMHRPGGLDLRQSARELDPPLLPSGQGRALFSPIWSTTLSTWSRSASPF
jgi:hypothetical protein